MDDFLHNLRSGKLKQADRGNRSYNDPQYKGSQRRNTNDRRKRELETFERLNAVKEVLENISVTQQRMAVAYEARTKAEERKAHALEVLAKNIYSMVNPDADDVEALFAPEPVAEIAPPVQEEPSDEIPADPKDAKPPASPKPAQPDRKSEKLSANDRDVLFAQIEKMREEGNSWEKIARRIASDGYPTSSGRGVWRGITAKNLYEKMSGEK